MWVTPRAKQAASEIRREAIYTSHRQRLSPSDRCLDHREVIHDPRWLRYTNRHHEVINGSRVSRPLSVHRLRVPLDHRNSDRDHR